MTDFDVDALIAERSNTHGDYLKNADITWKIKAALHEGRHYDEMHPAMKETLDMVAHKMHRIVNGDPWFKDHWVDMTGYPHLVVGNWDRLVGWNKTRHSEPQTQYLPHSDTVTIPQSFVDALQEMLASEGLRLEIPTSSGEKMRLQRRLTPAQEAMAADRAAAAPSAPGLEAAGRPLGTLPAAPEAAPATLVAAAPEKGAGNGLTFQAGDRIKTKNSKDWLVVDSPGTTNIGGDLISVRQPPSGVLQTVNVSDVLVHERIQHVYAADDGVSYEEPEEPQMPSMVLRQPIDATAKEYETIADLEIRHGPQVGHKWGELYSQREDGRYSMANQFHANYGR